MTVVELRSLPIAPRTRFDDLLLHAAASATALVERRSARRAARAAVPAGTGADDATRVALAGAHAHGLLPR